MCATFGKTYEGNQISGVSQLPVPCIRTMKKEKHKKVLKTKCESSRKSVVGLELEGNLCTKLPKLASFCCRHEWGAGEIENSFKFVQYKILEERMVLMRYRLKNLLLSKLTRKNMDAWVMVRSSKHC